MNRRERLERKLEKRREWALKRKTKASQGFAAAGKSIEHIPPGQPILVGHHSEKRHRRDLERHDGKMRRACEDSDMAAHHDSKASGLESQLDQAIFSDDGDALEQLELRIEYRETRRARIKEINRAIRAGKHPSPPLTERERAELASLARVWGSVYKPGYPPYELTNLGASIRRDKQRLAEIQARKARAESAEASESGVSILRSDKYCSITFAERPDREILAALRSAGFRWRGGSWHGLISDIPADIDND